MQYRSRSSRDIEIAFSLETPTARIEALRRLSNELSREDVPACYRSHKKRIDPGIVSNGQNKPLKGGSKAQKGVNRRHPSELDLIAATTTQNLTDIISILTDLTGLPAKIIENVFASEEELALLMISRAMNFAWSTVLILMDIRENQFIENKRESYKDHIDMISEWYGSHSRRSAARALRFIAAYAQTSRRPVSLTEFQRA